MSRFNAVVGSCLTFRIFIRGARLHKVAMESTSGKEGGKSYALSEVSQTLATAPLKVILSIGSMSTNLRSQKQKQDAEEHQFTSLNKNWQRPVALRITFLYTRCPFHPSAITTPIDYEQHTKNRFFGHECPVLVSHSFAHYEARTFTRT